MYPPDLQSVEVSSALDNGDGGMRVAYHVRDRTFHCPVQ